MAVRTGLEPATSCVTGRHSNQLNYRTLSLATVVVRTGLELCFRNRGAKITLAAFNAKERRNILKNAAFGEMINTLIRI